MLYVWVAIEVVVLFVVAIGVMAAAGCYNYGTVFVKCAVCKTRTAHDCYSLVNDNLPFPYCHECQASLILPIKGTRTYQRLCRQKAARDQKKVKLAKQVKGYNEWSDGFK